MRKRIDAVVRRLRGRHVPAGRFPGRLVPVVAVTLLAASAVSGCQEESPQAGPSAAPPPAVTVVPVTRQAVIEAVDFVGRVEAIDHVDLRARVTGFLIERAFEEGEDVAEGDLLFVIEPEPYEAAAARARAELQRAEAMVPQTQNALTRAQELFGRGNVSEAALDQAVADAAQANADVAAQEAALVEAELNLGYTRITSPLVGRTSRTAYSEGNLVGPDSGVLASVTSMDPIYVTFNVSERDLIQFQRDAQAGNIQIEDIVLNLRLPDDSAYDQEGRIDYVAPAVDPNTGTVSIRGVFPNPDRLLLPGQFVTVVASGREPAQVLVVPQAAVQQDQAGAFVLTVADDNTVLATRVATGRQEGTGWIIEGGLNEGDLVIVQGLQRVRPGIVVTPTTAADAAGG